MTPSLLLYAWATPNAQRVSIMLEELGLEYAVRPVNIRAGEQRSEEIRRLNPYGRIPILVEQRDGQPPLVLFESGAILLHLAERHGRFLPAAGDARATVMAWLMVALTGLAPLTGQAHHWTSLAETRPQAVVRHHVGLVARAYAVIEGRLAASPFLGGDAVSVADIAAFPWIARHAWAAQDLPDYPAIAAWFAALAARPAVQRGMDVPRGVRMD